MVPRVSLTRSRDGSTGTATFVFERPKVVGMYDVWDNGLITGLWLHDEEGRLHSEDLSLRFVDGRPAELEARGGGVERWKWGLQHRRAA